MSGMRVAILFALVAATALAGCTDDGDAGPEAGSGDPDGTDGAAGTDDLATLRFVAENRSTAYANQTLTVGPEDACVPSGCAASAATGDHRGDWITFIDISDALEPGMHAFVEIEATTTRDNPTALIGTNNLQWWPFGIWVTDVTSSAEAGRTTLTGYVTRGGDDPAQALFVLLDPDQAQTYEVDVTVRVTPLDDEVQATHVVAAGLQGDNASITVDGEYGQARLHVLRSDGEQVLEKTLSATDRNATLPANTPPGEYLLTVFDSDGPVRFQVPQGDLLDSDAPFMQIADTGIRLGDSRDLPPQGELSWDIEPDGAPYLLGVAFDALDGQGATLDAHISVTTPEGTEVISRDIGCTQCGWGVNSASTGAMPSLTSGTYTVTVTVDTAGSWEVAEFIGEYGL